MASRITIPKFLEAACIQNIQVISGWNRTNISIHTFFSRMLYFSVDVVLPVASPDN